MVEWKKLGEVCVIKNGYTPSTKENSYWENGTLPWFTLEDIRKNGRILEDAIKHITSLGVKKGGLFPKDSIIVSTTATIGEYALIKSDFLCNQQITCLTIKTDLKEQLLPKYLYYLSDRIGKWCKKNVNGGGSLLIVSTSKLNNFLIPIPSIEEQNRIVGILDTFTASIDNLKEQIALRRKQYEYYRDLLLDLEGKEGVEMKTIGDLFVFKNGLNKEKKYFGEGTPIVNYTDVYHNKRLDSSILNGRVTLSESEIDRFRVHKGDVFFTRTSETPEEVGYAAVMLEEVENCTFSGFLLRARPITNLLLPEFCAYCFGSYKVRQSIIKYSTFTTRALTNGPSLSKISVPVPSLSEQQRIVDILDKFEASIQNLEAQLSQREKQYEYYRNKLLTFE